MTWRRYPATPQPRIVHSLGEDDHIRFFRALIVATPIGAAMWVGAVWLCTTFFAWVQG
jgi:hypothetical protein